MVNISPILQALPYVQGKTVEQVSAAVAAAEQLSHAQMATVVTNFLDDLINSETKTAAGNTSNSEVKKTVQEVAGDLARHVFTVKELLVQDGSALKKKADGSTQFLAKADSDLTNSVNNLTEQAINLVNTKLSDYGINIDNSLAKKLQKEIIQQLKKPPERRSTAATTDTASTTTTSTAAPTATPAKTTSTLPENPNISIMDFLKEKQSELTKGLLESKSIVTFLNQQTDKKTGQKNGMSLLRDSNQTIKNEIAKSNPNQIDSALKNFDANLAENTKFIETHLGKNSFPNAFTKLTDDKKIQVGILLKNIEITVDEKTMVDLTGRITGQLGENTKKNLQTRLTNLINEFETPANSQDATAASTLALNLNKANKYLEQYNGALKEIKNKNLPTPQEIAEKQKATDKFLEQIQESLNDKTLSIEEVKIIAKSLTLKNEERESGKASPAIDNILGNFIDTLKEKGKELGLNITEESLKQFAGSAVVLAIGATLFCPNLIGNLAKGAFSLGTMMTQTVIPLYERHAQNNMIKALAQNKQNSH
jgi:hypothetical protein